MTHTTTSSPYPAGRRGAISLTFDDGLPSQLHRAVPMLNKYGLRATFYVCPRGADWEERLAPWREVAAAGHELGSHTINHICSRALRGPRDEAMPMVSEAKSLEDCTLAEMEEDIALAAQRIQQLAPQQADTSFAYPCWQTHIGEGLNRQSYVPIVAQYHIAGRALGELANHPGTATLHCLSSWGAERAWGPTLVGLAERCATDGRWGIFAFHGIDEGHLAINDVDFEELCRHLALHSDRIWVAPVAEVARAILDWRQGQEIANSS